MTIKTCQACDHPERTSVEDALSRGESYRELTRQFGVSIGQLKRHRKGHLNDDGYQTSGDQQDEEVFLRWGGVPEGGCSYNAQEEEYEEGLSVFRGRRMAGGYVFDFPREEGLTKLLAGLFYCMVGGRPLYVAHGTEIDEVGMTGGEALLEDATLLPVSPLVRVELPEWLGPKSKKLVEDWNRSRRGGGRRGLASNAESFNLGLREQAAEALVEAEFLCDPSKGVFDNQAEREREARRAVRRQWKG